ncbi:YcaO-like family protein [Haliangium sp.]|uniref:YcaO-like family protein n=1 Tax=Haliangium sp. TaxID=2663208 RepID=UPI003D0DB4B7
MNPNERQLPAIGPGAEVVVVGGRGAAPARCYLHHGGRLTEIAGIDADDLSAVVAAVAAADTYDAAFEALAARYHDDDVTALLELLSRALGATAPATPRPTSRPHAHVPVLVIGEGLLGRALAERVGETCAVEQWTLAELARGDDGHQLTRVHPGLSNAAMALVVLDDTALADGLRINQLCLAADTPALFVTVLGAEVAIGPLLLPWRTPCLYCALLCHYAPRAPHLALGVIDALSAAALPDDSEIQRAAVEAAVLAQLMGFWDGGVVAGVETLTLIDHRGEARTRRFGSYTRCPHCHGMNRDGVTGPSEAIAKVVEVAVDDVDAGSDLAIDVSTGVRSVPHDEARRRALHAFDWLGVAPEVVHRAPPPTLVQRHPALAELHFVHVRARAPLGHRGHCPRLRRQARALGKGATFEQAWCSAVYEWFEESFSEYAGGVELVRAPSAAVRAHALDLGFACEGLLAGVHLRGKSAVRDDVELDWVWARDLAAGRPTLIPAVMAYGLANAYFAGSELALPERGSSGIAAGCTWHDAVLEALLEVLEHDANFAAAATRLPFPRLRLDTVDDAVARSMLDALGAAGYEVQVRSLGNDIGLPVLEASLHAPRDPTHHFATGLGCHLDARIALRRCLAEGFQMLCYQADSGSGYTRDTRGSVFDSGHRRRRVLGGVEGELAMSALPTDAPDTVSGCIERCVALVTAAIPRAQVCAFSYPVPAALGIHVVSVVVPGAFDPVPIPLHIPSRVLDYRARLGRPGPRFRVDELCLEPLPP